MKSLSANKLWKSYEMQYFINDPSIIHDMWLVLSGLNRNQTSSLFFLSFTELGPEPVRTSLVQFFVVTGPVVTSWFLFTLFAYLLKTNIIL